jgi:AcrR family transcriptional regulator
VLAGRDDQVDVGRAPGMPAAGREEPAERAVVGDQRPLAAIIAAAQELQRHGTAPTVEQVADKARVSRATAYRYFPTKEALLVEVSDITPALAPVETLLANSATGDVEQRLLLLLDTFNRIVLAEEEHVRTGIRVYMDSWLRSHATATTRPSSARAG